MPMCYHTDDPDKAIKVYKHAVAGLDNKFKGFGDTEYSLKSFASDILHHLEECGLDSIFMLQVPQGTYYNVITYHALSPLFRD